MTLQEVPPVEEQPAEAAAPEVAPGEFRITAPTFPWELILNNSASYFQKMPDGSMILKFAPAMATPQGVMPMPPGVAVTFSPDGWERFKRQVEADGELPAVQTATVLPSGVRI